MTLSSHISKNTDVFKAHGLTSEASEGKKKKSQQKSTQKNYICNL